MRLLTLSVKKYLANLLIMCLLLPMILVVFTSVPVLAEGLTKEDAYKGLMVAALIVIVARVAKMMSSDSGRTTQTSSNSKVVIPPSPPNIGTGDEFEVLVRVIYAESRGEPFEGQVAVGAVVLNRVKSSQFPNTIREVVYAPNQFTSVTDGQINLTPNESAYKAAREALAGKDPTYGALFFYNPKTARHQDFFKKLQVTVQIQNHVFLK